MTTDFDSFVEYFFARLADDNFNLNHSLTDYLKVAADRRRGDEANIVDSKITSVLIAALGYDSGESQYNVPHGGGRRTDFTVRINDYPRPCFVAESKNTATNDLTKSLSQLSDYMRSQGATRGLLIDGKTILTFELSSGQIVSTGEIYLKELIEKWRGESLLSENKTGVDAFDKHDRVVLQAFWQRFNKSAFAGLKVLIDDLTLTDKGDPHTSDGKTWRTQSRIKIFEPHEAEFNRALTKESARVIEMIALDVEAQLALRLDEYKQYEAEMNAHPNGLYSFKEMFERHWLKIFSQTQAWGISETRRNSYSHQLRLSFESGYNGLILDNVKQEIEFDVKEKNSSLPEKKKRKDAELKRAVREINQIVDEISLLRQVYHKRRETLFFRYRHAVETHQAFTKWKEKVATILLKTSDERKLQREFATQTAYVLFVRLLLVRILEDKELINRIFTNGGIALWFDRIEEQYLKHAEGRSTDYLLGMAYESAQHIYAHYYAQAFVFDWYKADRNLIVQLLHSLAGFDFADIDRDIIGHIYSNYVRSEHKHESGMYYTPINVVEYILNQVGYQGSQILSEKLLDPSCGSGAFLVSACRRQIETYLDYYKQQGKSKQDLSVDEIRQILNAVKGNLFGLELNPFACYLAETNLLIQVLDLIKLARAKNAPDISLDRFHIYNTDTLRYEYETHISLKEMRFPAGELPLAEQIKGGIGAFEDGFDFVVGNPPYVRADEGAEGFLTYREEIKREHPLAAVRDNLVLKWDLLIPFVALGVYLLRNETGKLGMITSNAIEQVGYASRLRHYILENCRIDEISFFPKMRLFEDAAVENSVFLLTKVEATENDLTVRKWHGQNVNSIIKTDSFSQVELGERIFRQTIQTDQFSDTIRLQEICYVSKGMVLHAHEENFSDAFIKDNLLSTIRDRNHPASYIEGEDLSAFELTDVEFLEYGAGLRAPSQISRPTFPELYNRRKLMRGETSAAWLDNGSAIENGWMYCNHSVILFVPWISLRDIENKSIQKEVKNQGREREDLENASVNFTLEYLLAILNATKTREILEGTTVSARRSRFQPDDFRKLPVPNASPAEQAAITEKVARLLELAEEFLNLRRDGWKIKTAENKVAAPARLSKYPSIRKSPFGIAKVAWGINVNDAAAHLASLRLKDNIFWRGKNQKAAEITNSVDPLALLWLEKQFKQFPADTSFQAAEAEGKEIPTSPSEASKALALLQKEESQISEKVEDFNRIRTEVDLLVTNLYEVRKT